MVGFNDIYALKAASEKTNVMQRMLVSGILIWISYLLKVKTTIINITVTKIYAQLCILITYLIHLQVIKSFP